MSDAKLLTHQAIERAEMDDRCSPAFAREVRVTIDAYAARIKELEACLKDCADDLASYVENEHEHSRKYPALERLPDDSELPTAADVRGILKADGSENMTAPDFDEADLYAHDVIALSDTGSKKNNLARAYLELRERIKNMPDNVAISRLGADSYEDEFRALGLWVERKP